MLTLATELVTVRFLEPHVYGFFALAFVISKFGGIVAAFGLRLAVIHFIPLYRDSGQRQLLVGTVIAALGLPLVIGAVLAGGLWILGDWVAAEAFSKPGAGPFISYAALLIPLVALIEVLGHIPRAFNRSLEQVLVRSLIPPAAFAVALAVLVLTKAPPISVIIGMIAAHGLATLVGFVFVTALLRREAPAAGRPEYPFKKLYLFALPILVNDVVLLGIAWSDILVLGVYAPPDQVGIYRVCLQISQLFFLLQNAVAAATAPLYSTLVEAKDSEQLQRVYGTGLRLAALGAIPASLIVIANAGDILSLFSPAFASGAGALVLRTTGQAAATCLGLAGVLLVAGGRPRVEMINGVITLACSLALNFMLVPRYGIDGAAVAFALSILVVSALRLVQVRRAFDVRTVNSALIRIVVVSALAVGLADLILSQAGLQPGGGLGIMAARIGAMSLAAAAALWLSEIRTKGLSALRPRPTGGSGANRRPEPAEAPASTAEAPPQAL